MLSFFVHYIIKMRKSFVFDVQQYVKNAILYGTFIWS